MNGYSVRNYLLKGVAQTAAGAATTVVSSEFPMSAEDSLRFVVRLTAATTTVVGSLTAKVQENWGDEAGWHDVGAEANIAIAADGTVEIRVIVDNATDQAHLPTAPRCRVVVTGTNAADTTSITEVIVSRRF